jgi:hypothetical protein
MQNQNYPQQQVTVTDVKMPFWSMVVFMCKWAVATIPAMLILAFAAAGVLAILAIILGMFGLTAHQLGLR